MVLLFLDSPVIYNNMLEKRVGCASKSVTDVIKAVNVALDDWLNLETLNLEISLTGHLIRSVSTGDSWTMHTSGH